MHTITETVLLLDIMQECNIMVVVVDAEKVSESLQDIAGQNFRYKNETYSLAPGLQNHRPVFHIYRSGQSCSSYSAFMRYWWRFTEHFPDKTFLDYIGQSQHKAFSRLYDAANENNWNPDDFELEVLSKYIAKNWEWLTL